ncbi:MAG: cadherin repeat domain-containing protein, partial [Actinobacteria bacterium]|nr:cadherin repeat domain-containing protein [Actinomycetota bacterium]
YTLTVTRRALPTVTTPTSASVTATGATLGGNVSADGGATVIERGVVYSLTSANADPVIGGTGVTRVAADAAGTGVFTKAITGLTAAVGYSFKAYAINSEGTSYSPVATFTPQDSVVTLSALTLSAGTLTPTFTSGTASYTGGTGTNTLTFSYTPQSAQSTADLATAATNALSGTIQDLAGNAVVASGFNGVNPAGVVAVDTLAPTVTITDSDPNTVNIADGTVTFTFTFSEAVTGFATGNVAIGNGTKGTFTAVSSTVYTLVVTPTAGSSGDITVGVSTTGVIDAAGNQATAPAQYTQAFDTLAPVFTSGSSASVLENVASGTVVYTASVGEAGIAYSLKAGVGDVSSFAINSSTGQVSIGASPNFEAKASYSFTVVATDAAGNVSERAVNLSVTDVNEAPTAVSLNNVT